MAGSTYSSNLKIELMTTGENSGTWGDITNTNLGTALEQAVIGLGNPDYLSDANLTITITNSNALQAARALVLNVTSSFGSLTNTRELVVPTIQKQYIVQNNTTGGQSITVKTSAGTGILVPNGRKAHLYVNGTDVVQMFDFVDINGGAIDGTTVGAASASTGAFTSLNASGATTLDGAVALGNASADLITVPGTVNSSLLFTDATYDIGATGATRPRNLFLSGAATVGGNLSVGGTLTLTGGVNLNGNVTVGDASTDTLTINATITSNLLFTDNTYDIGATGATRPRNLFLAGNATVGGAQTLTGALTVDSTTDSSSTTTGSIQTDGGLGVAKALFVGTTADVAGAVTLSGGTANGVAYLNGSKVLTSGTALTFDGTILSSTTVDTTNLEVTNIKAKDGTASITMADTTGIATFSKATVISTADATNAALRITQTGAGSALVVEDSTSPDATPFLIDAAGRVIAGYTALVAPDVNGPTIFPQMNVVGVTSTAQYAAFSYINAAANAPIVALSKSRGATIGTNTIVVNGDTIGIVKFTAADGTAFVPAASISAQVDGTPGLNDMPGRLVFNTTADGAATSTERMRIDSAGNVGIGTITPSSELHVARNDATSYDGAATDGQLAAGSTVFIQQTAGTNTGVAQIVFQPRSTFPYNRIVSSGGSAPFMTFVTNNAEAMRITSAQILSTTKDALINGLTVGRGDGAVATNTAVGASALASNTTGFNNTANGAEALRFTTTGSDNAANGQAALYSNTTGSANTATGQASLYSNSTGANNTANGVLALFNNTTASNNTAVGYQAGYSNTAGTGTFVGAYVGYANTTGVSNAAFGGYDGGSSAGAFRFNSTGSYNSAFGVGALGQNTTASYNTAVGYQAAYYVTGSYNDAFGDGALYGQSGLSTGTNNSAFGRKSLNKITSGIANVAVGTEALQANTTASSNTAVGYQSGYSNTIGQYSVYMGIAAGYSASSAERNTFIGAYAGQVTTSGFQTFVGQDAGAVITTGQKNTVLGRYNGNQGGFDIRTLSNYIVLSDGDGNPRIVTDDLGGTALSRRNNGGTASTGASTNFFSIGKLVTVVSAQSTRLRIVIAGSQGYGQEQAGETIINCTISNNNTITGYFYGTTSTSGVITDVVFKYETDGFVFYVKSSTFASTAAFVDTTSGYWLGASTDTGSTSAPAGSTAIPSRWNLAVGGYTQLSIENSGSLALTNAASQSGTGITFPATQFASSNANTLDDYEEGTFSPTIGAWSGTYANQAGWYTKTGRMVTCYGWCKTNASTGTFGSSFLALGGLPFAALSGTSGQVAVTGTWAVPSGATSLPTGYLAAGPIDGPWNGGTAGFSNIYVANGNVSNADITYFSAATSLEYRFQLTYFTN